MGTNLLLVVDNSTDFLTVGIALDGRPLEWRSIGGETTPSGIIALEAREVLQRHGYSMGDVNQLAATVGPGSFTGIRVALAFCKGLNAGRHIPFVGVPTLDALAAPLAFLKDHYLCPVIDAKKGEVFTALYRTFGQGLERLTAYRAVRPDALVGTLMLPCVCFGSGLALVAPFLRQTVGITLIRDGFSRVSAEALIGEAQRRLGDGAGEPPQPIYGRRSEAEIKFNVDLKLVT